MKTVITKAGDIKRVKDDAANTLVSTGQAKYCDKSTWKRIVRDKSKA